MNITYFNFAIIQRDYSTSDLSPQVINFSMYDFEYVSGGALSLTGSRIGNASRTWQANEDADVTDWDKSSPIIVAGMIEKS